MQKLFALTVSLTIAGLVGLPAVAAVDFSVTDQTPNGDAGSGTRNLSTTLGSVGAPPALPTTTYTVSGLDLTSVGGGVGETIAFDITYSAGVGSPAFNGFGNVADNAGNASQIDPGELLTVAVSLNAGLTTFTGVIDLGLTNIQIGGRDSDEQFTITHDGGVINTPEESNNSYGFSSSSFVSLATVDTDKSNDFGNLGGFTVSISADVIPEPGSIALLGLGSLLICRRRRRGRHP